MAKGRHGVVCSFNCVIHVWAPWGRDACHLRRYINPRTFTFTFTLLLTFRLYTGLQCLRSDARYFGYSNHFCYLLSYLLMFVSCLFVCLFARGNNKCKSMFVKLVATFCLFHFWISVETGEHKHHLILLFAKTHLCHITSKTSNQVKSSSLLMQHVRALDLRAPVEVFAITFKLKAQQLN